MYNFVIFFVSCVVLSSIKVSVADHIINSDGTTNWGVWGSMTRCPSGTFVVNWLQKVEPDQGVFVDDTAQNAIQMNCAYPSNPSTIVASVTSTVGPFGNWGSSSTCFPNLITGFNLRVESDRGSGDDTATNNFRARCSDGEIVEGSGMSWGSWRTEQTCNFRHAVCGIQTQVEPDQGDGDDTALNNVNLYCCELPNLAETCVPKQNYKEAVVCDNIGATSDSECVVSYEVGVGYVPGSERAVKGWERAGFTLMDAVKDLPKTFKTNMKDHESSSAFQESVFTERTVVSVTINIPPGIMSTFSYLAAECEHYSVTSRKIQRIDMSQDGRVKATTYFDI